MDSSCERKIVRALAVFLILVGSCTAQQATRPPSMHNLGDFFSRNHLKGALGIIRVEDTGKSFHVSEMYSVVMQSSPAAASPQTMELNLPTSAVVTSAFAAGPSDDIQRITPQPIVERIGYYSLPYPLRPGTTRFAVNYDLSSRDKITFRPTFPYPVGKLLIMYPRSMKLVSRGVYLTQPASGSQHEYQTSSTENIPAGQAIEFEVAVIKPGMSARGITFTTAATLAFILICAYFGVKRRKTNALA